MYTIKCKNDVRFTPSIISSNLDIFYLNLYQSCGIAFVLNSIFIVF
jgi:hypothetical protein